VNCNRTRDGLVFILDAAVGTLPGDRAGEEGTSNHTILKNRN